MVSFYCTSDGKNRRQLGDSGLLGSYPMSTIRVTDVSKDRNIFKFKVKKSQEDESSAKPL